MLILKAFLRCKKEIKQCLEGGNEVRGDFFEDGGDNEGFNRSRSYKDREEGTELRERIHTS